MFSTILQKLVDRISGQYSQRLQTFIVSTFCYGFNFPRIVIHSVDYKGKTTYIRFEKSQFHLQQEEPFAFGSIETNPILDSYTYESLLAFITKEYELIPRWGKHFIFHSCGHATTMGKLPNFPNSPDKTDPWNTGSYGLCPRCRSIAYHSVALGFINQADTSGTRWNPPEHGCRGISKKIEEEVTEYLGW